MQPAPRTIESNEIFQGSDEVVIAHGERRYRLRATRNGRLAMPGASPAVRRLGYLSVIVPVLFAGYLAGLPFAFVFTQAVLPASYPVYEVASLPAIFIYERCEPYATYCESTVERMENAGFLD